MINALLVNPEKNAFNLLEKHLSTHCPNIKIDGKVTSIEKVPSFLEKKNSNLLFVDFNLPDIKVLYFLNQLALKGIEFVVVSRAKEMAYEALKHNATGFILKPIDTEELIHVIHSVRIRIQGKEEKEIGKRVIQDINHKLSEDNLVGIPTMEGFDFVKINEIIRCEGLQRCTQIVTTHKKNIISSYNLGKFRGLLVSFCFFSPHRSHLINMNFIKKYKKEGCIIMQDGSSVPIARRRKAEFLNLILHL